jgi:hypothetical protein
MISMHEKSRRSGHSAGRSGELSDSIRSIVLDDMMTGNARCPKNIKKIKKNYNQELAV